MKLMHYLQVIFNKTQPLLVRSLLLLHYASNYFHPAYAGFGMCCFRQRKYYFLFHTQYSSFGFFSDKPGIFNHKVANELVGDFQNKVVKFPDRVACTFAISCISVKYIVLIQSTFSEINHANQLTSRYFFFISHAMFDNYLIKILCPLLLVYYWMITSYSAMAALSFTFV